MVLAVAVLVMFIHLTLYMIGLCFISKNESKVYSSKCVKSYRVHMLTMFFSDKKGLRKG